MVCLPLEPVGVRPLAQRLAEGKVLDPAADQCRLALAAGSGGVRAAAEAVVRVQAAVPGLVRDREAVAVDVSVLRERSVDQHRVCAHADVLSAIRFGVVDGELIRVVENGHAEIDAVVRQVPELLMHSELHKGKAVHVDRGRFLQDFGSKLAQLFLRELVKLVLAEHRQAAGLCPKSQTAHPFRFLSSSTNCSQSFSSAPRSRAARSA